MISLARLGIRFPESGRNRLILNMGGSRPLSSVVVSHRIIYNSLTLSGSVLGFRSIRGKKAMQRVFPAEANTIVPGLALRSASAPAHGSLERDERSNSKVAPCYSSFVRSNGVVVDSHLVCA